MCALDDPQNPYRDYYAEWDAWGMAHSGDVTEDQWEQYYTALAAGSEPPFEMYYLAVDDAGFALPLMESERRNLALSAGELADTGCSLSFHCCGEMPPELRQRLEDARLILRATGQPAVPQWLADNPPAWATVLPNGCVLCCEQAEGAGQLEMADTAHYPLQAPFPAAGPFCAYTPDGQLIGRADAGRCWWEALFASFVEVQNNGGQPLRAYEMNGYIVFIESGSGTWLSIYDYDGSPVPLEQGIVQRGQRLFPGWPGRQIPLVYAAQQQAQALPQR